MDHGLVVVCRQVIRYDGHARMNTGLLPGIRRKSYKMLATARVGHQLALSMDLTAARESQDFQFGKELVVQFPSIRGDARDTMSSLRSWSPNAARYCL